MKAWSALLLLLLAGVAQAAPVHVTILAVNDIHGNLEPPPVGVKIADPAHPGQFFNIPAGGLDRMATLVKRLRAQNRNSIFVAGGDLVGASPLISGLFHDEPTIEVMSRMGLDVSSVGNHEFDQGIGELLRKQKGGCHPVDGCKLGHVFQGAKFRYLAASPVFTATGKSVLPPYYIRRFEGIPVAFIGLTRVGTLGLISPKAATGLTFKDDAATVNALVPKLKAQGINAIVLLIHGGGNTSGGINDCNGVKGELPDEVRKFDPAIKLIISADSHWAYICHIDGRLVTQAYRYGTLVTKIDIELDRKRRAILDEKAVNLVVDPNLPPDPAIAKMIDDTRKRAGVLKDRVIATLPAPLLQDRNDAGESALGDLVADSMLPASDHARIGFMNKGGIRISIAKAGPVTYGDLYAVLPFGNQLVTLDLTGAQLKTLLEQQWADPKLTRILQVSKGFSYAWDDSKPYGQRISAMTLDGVPIAPEATYRVVVPDFVADGGDSYTIMKEARNRAIGPPALDALVDYLPSHVPPDGKPAGRIRRVNAP